jgi:hypothetical protein
MRYGGGEEVGGAGKLKLYITYKIHILLVAQVAKMNMMRKTNKRMR